MSKLCTTKLRYGVLVLLLAVSACVPNAELLPDEVEKGLSSVIMNPAVTCEELRKSFGLEHLALVDTPDQAGIAYEEHWVAVPQTGQAVRMWYAPAKLNRGVVVISLGAVGSLPCYLFTTRLLTQNGWSVVSYEYEGFGLSTGTPSLLSLRPDLQAVVDWTIGYTGFERVTLLGISLGTIPTVAVAAESPEKVNGVMLDSPVALRAEIERFRLLVGGQDGRVLAALPDELVSERIIGDMRVPSLIFMHERDDITPTTTVKLLFDLAPAPKTLVSFPSLNHARGQYFDTDRYVFAAESFLSGIWTYDAAPQE